MISSLLAALLLSSPADAPAVQATVPAPQISAAAVGQDAPTDLGDIVVEGARLEDTARSFVREVGAPAANRGLARWRNGICVGVANLQADTARYIVDRISDVTREVGLQAGEPGCEPNVLIVATTDANAFTPQFVAMRPRLFRVGGAGMDRGGDALEAFETNDQPVRWWHVSVPVDDRGAIAVRLPGVCRYQCAETMDFAPQLTQNASRLQANTGDDLKRIFIIVDVDRIGGVSLEQLGDYLAFVALAQVNPDADTSGYSTILNIFQNPTDTPALSQWDMAYLKGLYDAEMTRASVGAARQEVANSIVRTRRQMTAAEDETPETGSE
ncbi:hypothetical protein [Brevundimonas goettingensis]|uniref:Protein glutaminase domain-containing protein n=1 Tax=Brevundimonas goettingensis TaxID=2774190 RepID=A0A975C261_9CAUL|nr:hypothetical protein [Brevundimonas goettingensis]QTC92488.1 hypothetical protein IFJ75_06330 [Brevundimonas goettingensis]